MRTYKNTNALNILEKNLDFTLGILEKWKRIGMLDYIDSDQIKARLANALEYAYNLLNNDPTNKTESKFNAQYTTLLFPVIRRIFVKDNIQCIDLEYLVGELIKDFKLAYTNDFKKLEDEIGYKSNVDIELEFVESFSEKYIIKNEKNS